MSNMSNGLNRRQAIERAESHINAAVDQLQPRSALNPLRHLMFDCDDPDDHGPLGRVVVERRFELPAVLAEAGPAVLDALADYWTGNGYRILRDTRGTPTPEIAVEAPDGFRVIVKTNTLKQLAITGSSPCVWPSGSPPSGDR